jgi:8-oxo-dGTP diphosphatase
MSELPRHSVSVTGIVIRDDGRILAIQRRDDGRWVPPGGVLELDESPIDGVAREVLEETGIKVHAEQLPGVYKNMRLGVVTLAFRCRVIDGNAHTSDEAQRTAWLTVEEATRQMPEARAVRVTDAISGGVPAVRIHDGTDLLLQLSLRLQGGSPAAPARRGPSPRKDRELKTRSAGGEQREGVRA